MVSAQCESRKVLATMLRPSISLLPAQTAATRAQTPLYLMLLNLPWSGAARRVRHERTDDILSALTTQGILSLLGSGLLSNTVRRTILVLAPSLIRSAFNMMGHNTLHLAAHNLDAGQAIGRRHRRTGVSARVQHPRGNEASGL